MTTTLRDLQASLQRKTGFEVIDANESPTKLRLMGRLPADKMGLNLANWLLLVKELDKAGDGRAGWGVDISKKYFCRGEKTMYSWRLMFESPELAAKYEAILKVVMGAPYAGRGELSEFPLAGARADRNELNNRKGASSVKG